MAHHHSSCCCCWHPQLSPGIRHLAPGTLIAPLPQQSFRCREICSTCKAARYRRINGFTPLLVVIQSEGLGSKCYTRIEAFLWHPSGKRFNKSNPQNSQNKMDFEVALKREMKLHFRPGQNISGQLAGPCTMHNAQTNATIVTSTIQRRRQLGHHFRPGGNISRQLTGPPFAVSRLV